LIIGLGILFLAALGVGGKYLYQYLTGNQGQIALGSPGPSPSIAAQHTPKPVESPQAAETPLVQHTPSPKPAPHGSATPSPALGGGESYEKDLAAARQLRKNRDFDAALKAYLELADRNPDKQAEIQKDTQEMLAEEVKSLPTPRENGPSPQPTIPPPADSYSEELAAAQQLGKNGDWHGALRDYLKLMDRYPDRPEAAKRLDNLLSEARTSQGKIDQSSFAAVKPDLTRAAEKGVIPAMLLLGQFSRETDPASALSWYEKAAEKGNVPAMVETGLIYSNSGPGGEAKGLEYFVRAADAGDVDGKYYAGECYYHGRGAPANVEKAVEYLQQAAALNDPRAMDLLGNYFRKIQHFDQARKYFEDSVALGYPLSMANLGVMYVNGEGMARNPTVAANLFKQAADLFKLSAEKGSKIDMFFYAQVLWLGRGVPRDTKAATDWFKRSAKGGYPPAIQWCNQNKVQYK
jgi:TPR repeat protein